MTKPSRLLTASVFRRSSKKGFQTSSNSGKTSNTERLTLRLSVLGTFKNRRKCPRVEILNEIPSFKHYPLPPPLLPPPPPRLNHATKLILSVVVMVASLNVAD